MHKGAKAYANIYAKYIWHKERTRSFTTRIQNETRHPELVILSLAYQYPLIFIICLSQVSLN